MSQTETITQRIIQRIRDAIHPDRIILFGSRARGDGAPQSDFDILIIAPSSAPRWKRTVPIYRLLAGMGVSKDVVWWTPEEVEEWMNVRSHFITRALREGKVLYEKQGIEDGPSETVEHRRR